MPCGNDAPQHKDVFVGRGLALDALALDAGKIVLKRRTVGK